MASTLGFVQYVCGQAAGVGGLSCRRMFGEYTLYLHGTSSSRIRSAS